MNKKILVTFWIPPEVASATEAGFDLIYPREEVTGMFSAAEIAERLPEVDGVLVAGENVDKAFIDRGTKLKTIGRHGVGCDSVDCDYAGGKGIAVINTPQAVTQPTAELTIAIMLDAARRVACLDRQIRRLGKCGPQPSYDGLSTGVYGKTLGIIGFGRIGKAVAEKARGLGMKIIYADVVAAPKAVEEATGARRVERDKLLRTADFVSLHCFYTPENHHLINEKALSMMKPGAYLVNASRGKMVDEAALVKALKNKTIKGAALDVYEFEPAITSDLLAMENVVLAPHVGTCCYEARVAMALEALEGMCAFLKGGTPPNIFNAAALKR